MKATKQEKNTIEGIENKINFFNCNIVLNLTYKTLKPYFDNKEKGKVKLKKSIPDNFYSCSCNACKEKGIVLENLYKVKNAFFSLQSNFDVAVSIDVSFPMHKSILKMNREKAIERIKEKIEHFLYYYFLEKLNIEIDEIKIISINNFNLK